MGAKEEYEARKAAQETRRAIQQESRKKRPWWFRHPDPIAKFTGWVAIYTLVLAVATIGSAYILYKTDVTLYDTFVIAQRPWLSVKTAIASPLTLEGETLTIKLALTIKNTGRRPALSVYWYAAFTASPYYPNPTWENDGPPSFPSGTMADIQKIVCRANMTLQLGQGQGPSIFPDEQHTAEVTAKFYKTSASAGRFPSDVVVCIAYQTGFEEPPKNPWNDPTGRFTANAYRIEGADSYAPSLDSDRLKLRQIGSLAE